MHAASSCPEKPILERFVLNELDSSEYQRIEQHLLHCEGCLTVIEAASESDTVIEAVRRRGSQNPSPDPPHVIELIDRVRSVWTTRSTRSEASTNDTLRITFDSMEFSFLGPPEGPGELGRIGGYRVLRMLGKGGMGIVFHAEDLDLHRPVAIKVMRPELAAYPNGRERFLREARAAAAIKDDHVVTIHQVGQDRGVPFLAMELLEGEPLDERLKRDPKLPTAEILRIGCETALGLAAAHKRGLVHRDIKPANIWLEDDLARVKIVDFGLARGTTEESRLTQNGAIVGTPAYMAPEQTGEATVDHRSDLFSLGCVLYQLCTGEPPFKGNGTLQIISSLATHTPKSPHELNQAIPLRLSNFIMSLLAKDADDRPASAVDVAAMLAEFAQHETHRSAIQDRPATAPQVQRARAVGAFTAIATAVVLLGFMAAGIVLYLKNRNGTVVVNLTEPDVQVIADGNEAVVVDSKAFGQVEFSLKPGQHKVVVKRGGEELFAESFTLTRAGYVIDAKWVPKAGNERQSVNSHDEDDWLKSVIDLEPELQVRAVIERLKDCNPSYDGNATHKIEKGAVTEFVIGSTEVFDLSPLRAFKNLRALACTGSPPNQMGKLMDLSPLKGMKLVRLNVWGNQIRDISPLKDMPLQSLEVGFNPVKDLSPIRGMPLTLLITWATPIEDLSPVKDMKLTLLNCGFSPVSDLSPLKGMPLKDLNCQNTHVSDLSSLRGLPLTQLNCRDTNIADLAPLKGMPLSELWIELTAVKDLSPLAECPLRRLTCNIKSQHDVDVVRSITTLQTLNGKDPSNVLREWQPTP